MGENRTITCDACEKDITYTTNCKDYRLILGSQSKDSKPGINMVTAMHISPSIDRTKYFCGLSCLQDWIIQ